MKFVTHPQHNRWLGAPLGWDHTKVLCGALSIHDQRDKSTPRMESTWEAEGFEPLALALGLGQIRLAVYGQAHPPVSLTIWPAAREHTKEDLRDRYNNVLALLEDHARTSGLMLVGGRFIVAP